VAELVVGVVPAVAAGARYPWCLSLHPVLRCRFFCDPFRSPLVDEGKRDRVDTAHPKTLMWRWIK
jgi:hypothetical protein